MTMQKHLKHLGEVTMRWPLTISVSLEAMETASHNIIWAFCTVMVWVLKKIPKLLYQVLPRGAATPYVVKLCYSEANGDAPAPCWQKKGRLHLLKEAAFLGHDIAPLEIGIVYYSRQETGFDLFRAMVWWIVSSYRNAPGLVEMISSVSPLLSRVQMDQVTVNLADCDNKSYRDCLSNFWTPQTVSSVLWTITWRYGALLRARISDLCLRRATPITSQLILQHAWVDDAQLKH